MLATPVAAREAWHWIFAVLRADEPKSAVAAWRSPLGKLHMRWDARLG